MKTKLIKKIFDREKFEEIVNTGFTELSNVKDPTFFDVNLATIEDFFILYEKLFYDIPKEGPSGSHEYIVEKSGNYINFENINATIEALTQEINSLREENLNLLSGNIETESNKIIDNIKNFSGK